MMPSEPSLSETDIGLLRQYIPVALQLGISERLYDFLVTSAHRLADSQNQYSMLRTLPRFAIVFQIKPFGTDSFVKTTC